MQASQSPTNPSPATRSEPPKLPPAGPPSPRTSGTPSRREPVAVKYLYHRKIVVFVAFIVSDLQDFASGSAGGTEEVLDLIEKQTGEVQHLALGLTPHIVFKNFGIGAGLQFAGNIVFHRYPSVDMRLGIGPDVVVPISYAMNFFENR